MPCVSAGSPYSLQPCKIWRAAAPQTLCCARRLANGSRCAPRLPISRRGAQGYVFLNRLNKREEGKGKHVDCLQKKCGWHVGEMMPRGVATSPLSGLALVRHKPLISCSRWRENPLDILCRVCLARKRNPTFVALFDSTECGLRSQQSRAQGRNSLDAGRDQITRGHSVQVAAPVRHSERQRWGRSRGVQSALALELQLHALPRV